MDKGRGDLCCTAVSIDLWTIDLPRPPNHKILLDAGESAAFSSIFLASSFLCSQAESTPAPAPVTQTVGQFLAKDYVSSANNLKSKHHAVSMSYDRNKL